MNILQFVAAHHLCKGDDEPMTTRNREYPICFVYFKGALLISTIGGLPVFGASSLELLRVSNITAMLIRATESRFLRAEYLILTHRMNQLIVLTSKSPSTGALRFTSSLNTSTSVRDRLYVLENWR